MSKEGGNGHHKIKKSIKRPSPVWLVISTSDTQLCPCLKETSLWEMIYASSNKNVIGKSFCTDSRAHTEGNQNGR